MSARRTSQSLRPFALLATVAVLALMAPTSATGSFRDRTPPSVPQNLRVVEVTSSTATFAWSLSTDNRAVASYTVCPVSAGSCVRVDHPETRATLTGLPEGRTMLALAYATDTSGNWSGWTPSVEFSTTSDAPAPSAPSGLTVLGTSASTVELRWTSSTGELPFYYDVLVDGEVTPNAMSTMPAGTIPRPPMQGAVVRQLDPSTTYTFAVRARAVSGNVSATTNTVTATTGPSADTTPPGPAPVVTNVNAGVAGGICPEEVWTWFTGSTDNSGFVEYEVRFDGVIQEVVSGVRAITYTEVLGPFDVSIVAVDAAGNASAPSAPYATFMSYNPCFG